jgi:hypothetical protein
VSGLTDEQLAGAMSAPALSDEEYEIVDRISLALEAAGPAGLTPSRAARKARTDTLSAGRLLQWLVRGLYAHTSGNGCWTHYHAGRAR